MVYKVIGLMSGSSLDGLDLVLAELQEQAGKWSYEIIFSTCYSYEKHWEQKLRDAPEMTAKEYSLLHTDYGRYIGETVNAFIEQHSLQHQVGLVSSHGHTTFHLPQQKMTHQLGEGAAIAAATRLPVVTDLRSMDVAFGGQGAPIVPLGEKLLFNGFHCFLNIGGIANISVNSGDNTIAFDVCAANRVLNMLANEKGLPYDNKGTMASRGSIDEELLTKLNSLEYYTLPYPKSLANDFGTETVYPLIKTSTKSIEDGLRTYTEHIAMQIKTSLQPFERNYMQKLFITGGGAFNDFLIERIREKLAEINFEIFIPSESVVKYKEALIMALLGVLRWREQYTVLSSVTGAIRNSIGGALWLGTEA